MSISQKEAVYAAVTTFMSENNIPLEGAVQLSVDDKNSIVAIVLAGIQAGDVGLSEKAKKKYETTASLEDYVQSLVSGSLRKDTRINGGSKYVPKKPGIRKVNDQVLKNLRQIKKVLSDKKEIELVSKEITARIDILLSENNQ